MLNDLDSGLLLNRLAHQADLVHQNILATEIEKAEYNLFVMLKPKFGIDGNQYYVLYGDNLQEGVVGFGDTLYLAILDFNKKFNEKVLSKKPK